MFTYLAVDAILLFFWLVLFVWRKDLRRKILFLSLITVPLGVFDYLSQPSYWHPPTFFGLPVGIEGCIFGFCIGGISAVIYEEVAKKHIRKFKKDRPSFVSHLLAPLGVVGASLLLYWCVGINMMYSLPIGLCLGLLLIVLVRPDLKGSVMFSGLAFGIFYFLVFFVWLTIFPDAKNWWNMELYRNWAVLGVPFGEVLFGFLYGAFWGPIYEYVFDYKVR